MSETNPADLEAKMAEVTLQDDTAGTVPARDFFHQDKEACEFIIKSRTISMVPVEIRVSRVASPGSGLFYTGEKTIDLGTQIYQSQPLMVLIDPTKKTVCHHCYVDTDDPGHVGRVLVEGLDMVVKACTGCRAARFCSRFCQKRGWKLFHRDECGILKNSPDLSTKNLATHRLLLWQERGLLGNDLTRAILLLETHFREIVDGEDKDRATQLIVGGDGIRKATNSKMSTGAVWKLFGAMLTNSTFVRQAHHSEPFGTAFDLLTSMINHSCAPNAFVFLEGRALRVRALAPIRPGDEITICYLDPTIHVSKRMELLKKDHFFDCCCTRCKAEIKEEMDRLSSDLEKAVVLHDAQQRMVDLMRAAMRTLNHPGMQPDFENPDAVHRSLLHLAKSAFGDEEWYPDHMDPMPMANMCLGQLYLRQKKLPIALRLILKSKLCSRRRNGPEFVNEMFEVMRVLVMVGDLPGDAPEYSNSVFPQKSEIRTIARGYVYEMYTAAGQVYGGDSILTGVVGEIYENLTKNMGRRPGSKEFRDEFVPAQQKLLAWAGIDVAHGLVLSD